MKMLGSVFSSDKNIRPIFSPAECSSAELIIGGRDHFIGISTFCLICVIWVLTLIFA